MPKETRIIEFKPKFVKLLHDRKAYDLIKNKNYKFVLKALRDGPLTVKELVEAYYDISGNKKSDKTIYRYLNKLQTADLITNAGYLVTHGKKTNETLFSRTAIVFHLYPIKTLSKQPDKLDRISKGVSLLLNHDEKFELDTVKDIISQYEQAIQNAIENMGDKNQEKLEQYFKQLEPYEIEKVMDLSSLFIVISHNTQFINQVGQLL